MRYVLLIYGSEEAYAQMTQGEGVALMQAHAVFAQEAQKRGLLTGGEPLQPTRTATTIRIRMATKIPDALFGSVEIRPIREL